MYQLFVFEKKNIPELMHSFISQGFLWKQNLNNILHIHPTHAHIYIKYILILYTYIHTYMIYENVLHAVVHLIQQ